MSGQETGGLRQRIAEALRNHDPSFTTDAADDYQCCVDAVMVPIQPELDARDAEIKTLSEAYWKAREETEALRSEKDAVIGRIGSERMAAIGRAQAEAERDRLREQTKQTDELLAAITLYITWRYVTRNLRTDQKDLFADAIERHENHMHGPDGEDPDPSMAGLPSYTPRWWRDDAALGRPQDPEDT